MNAEELKDRTKGFGIRIIKLVESLPRTRSADIIGKQLIKSATSIGANYRAACRSRSRAEFISKVNIVEEEADESAYWLEILAEVGLLERDQVATYLKEANELTAIFVASGKTAKFKNPKSEIRNPK